MTKNKRYEHSYDELQAQRQAAADAAPRAVTLPLQAYGPQPIEWAAPADRPSVLAWVSWSEGTATRIQAHAYGWNDRVVHIGWYSDEGERRVTVWRNAVTRRAQ